MRSRVVQSFSVWLVLVVLSLVLFNAWFIPTKGFVFQDYVLIGALNLAILAAVTTSFVPLMIRTLLVIGVLEIIALSGFYIDGPSAMTGFFLLPAVMLASYVMRFRSVTWIVNGMFVPVVGIAALWILTVPQDGSNFTANWATTILPLFVVSHLLVFGVRHISKQVSNVVMGLEHEQERVDLLSDTLRVSKQREINDREGQGGRFDFDYRTGLMSRRALERLLTPDRRSDMVGLVLIRLTNFQEMQDTFGRVIAYDYFADLGETIYPGKEESSKLGHWNDDSFLIVIEQCSSEELKYQLDVIEENLRKIRRTMPAVMLHDTVLVATLLNAQALHRDLVKRLCETSEDVDAQTPDQLRKQLFPSSA